MTLVRSRIFLMQNHTLFIIFFLIPEWVLYCWSNGCGLYVFGHDCLVFFMYCTLYSKAASTYTFCDICDDFSALCCVTVCLQSVWRLFPNMSLTAACACPVRWESWAYWGRSEGVWLSWVLEGVMALLGGGIAVSLSAGTDVPWLKP